LPYLVSSDDQPDGTPPQIRSTVETIEEAAGVLLTLAGCTQVRFVDGDNPEYGEGIQTRRIRGQDKEFNEPQLYLGGRPLNHGEHEKLVAATSELREFSERFNLKLGGGA